MPSSLRALQKESGASFALVFEADLPTHYGDVAAEWAAARKACAVIDAGWRGLLRVTGSERAVFLQGMLSNQVKTLNPGDGIHAAHLTVQGRVVADMRVLALEEEIWLDVPIQRKTTLRQTLERYLVADDVEFIDDETIVPLLTLTGPQSPDVAAAIFGADFEYLAPLAHTVHAVDGGEFRIVSASDTGERGFLIVGDRDAGAHLWQRSCEAGAVPAGMQALDILRIEAGIPWCDRDMDENVLAPEVGLESAISFNKGCYIGQEVVERVAARGQVQRKLTGLQCDGASIPAAGTKILRDGDEVGAITSAAQSPACDAVIALGYVRRSAWEPGTRLQLAGGGNAHVVALPFVGAPVR